MTDETQTTPDPSEADNAAAGDQGAVENESAAEESTEATEEQSTPSNPSSDVETPAEDAGETEETPSEEAVEPAETPAEEQAEATPAAPVEDLTTLHYSSHVEVSINGRSWASVNTPSDHTLTVPTKFVEGIKTILFEAYGFVPEE